MPGIETDPLILPIIARTDQMTRAVKGAKAQFSTDTEQMKRASAGMRRQLESDSAAVSASFKRMAGALAGYFSGREILNLVNSYTAFTNSLRVAGVASADLGAVQDRLFATAQRYGVELSTLGSLFGSLTNASKELGASQEQIFKLTDTVAASLKVSGQSATQASGALLQLGQALRGGKVQAEEYNSLLDGMFPLLEAAAAGSERWGGSVAKLTKDVKDGKVASQELFAAILNGSEGVIKRAESTTLSLSSAYTQLTNALTKYTGEAAQSTGAQAALVAAIGKIADNLDTLIPALAIVGTALGVKYVLSAGAATLATIRADAALLGLTTRAEVAGFAIGSFARALAINGALLAVTAAIGALAGEMATADALVQQANTSFDEMQRRLEAAGQGAKIAGDGNRGVGDGAAAAEPKVRAFAGAVGELANQLYRQAQAARAARVETLQTRLKDSQSAELELMKRTPAGRQAEVADMRPGGVFNIRNWPAIKRNAAGDLKNWWTEGGSDTALTDAYRKQVAISLQLQRELKDAQGKPLAEFIDMPRATASAPTAGGRSRGGGSSGANRGGADQIREQHQRTAAEVAAAQIGYMQELANSTHNAAERAAIEQRGVEAMRKAAETDIKNNEAIQGADREKLLEINNQVAALRKQQIVDREADRLRQEQLSIAAQSLRDEDAVLQRQSDLATTLAERRAIELRRVDIAHQLERAQLQEELSQAEIAKDTARIAAARKRIADLEANKPSDQAVAKRATETPFERYRRELGDPRTQVEEAVVQKLDDVSDGIADAISGFIGTKDPLISQLLKVLIDQVLMKPIADALASAGGTSTSGLVGGAGGILGGILSGIGAIFGGARAAGGPVAAGRAYLVGERGPELMVPASSGNIIPNGALTNARAARPAAQPSVVQIQVEGSRYFEPHVRQISGNAAVQVFREGTPGVIRQAVSLANQSAPAALRYYQRNGTTMR